MTAVWLPAVTHLVSLASALLRKVMIGQRWHHSRRNYIALSRQPPIRWPKSWWQRVQFCFSVFHMELTNSMNILLFLRTPVLQVLLMDFCSYKYSLTLCGFSSHHLINASSPAKPSLPRTWPALGKLQITGSKWLPAAHYHTQAAALHSAQGSSPWCSSEKCLKRFEASFSRMASEYNTRHQRRKGEER